MTTGRIASFSAAALALMVAAAPAAAQGQSQSGQQGSQDRPPQMRQAERDVRNQMLADLVFLRLAESPSLEQASIRVMTQDGVVTLEGTVPSQEAKQRAVAIARRTLGVQQVRDQLRVDQQAASTAAQNVDDGELTKQIAQKLASETFPNAEAQQDWFYGWEVENTNPDWEFDVEADNGVIQMHGTVGSFSDIRRAVETALEVPGVRAVRNDLRVEGLPYYGRYYGGYYGPYGAYGPYVSGPYAAYGPYGPPIVYGPGAYGTSGAQPSASPSASPSPQ